MNHLLRLGSARIRSTMSRSPEIAYVYTRADLAHKPSSYRRVLVRAHMRACCSIEQAASSVRFGWHLKD